MIYQDFRKNAMQADEIWSLLRQKAIASKIKQADSVDVLQPKADHRGNKIRFTVFRWIGPYIIEKVLVKNNCLVRKTGTNKTQVLHRMLLCQFTYQQPRPDEQSTPQEWKLDPEVSIVCVDKYARAWECNYKRPIFDAQYDNTAPPCLPEIVVRSDLPTGEMWNIPGTSEERYPESFPSTDGI